MATKKTTSTRRAPSSSKISQQELLGIHAAINRSQAVIEFQLDGTILNANENFLNTLGYTLEEIQGKHHSMFVDASFRTTDEYRQFWAKLGRGEVDAGQYRRIGKGGKEVWIQASYNPILDAKGKPVKVVKFATDITQRYLQDQLNAAFKGALDGVSANVMVANTDLDITYMNSTAMALMSEAQADFKKDLPQFEAAKLIGTNIDVFHKNPAHQRGLLKSLDKTFTSQLKLGGRTMQIVANPMRDTDGNRLGTVVEWLDLTESLRREEENRIRAEKEAAVAADNARIKQALDKVTTNVMMADEDLNIIYLNDTVRDMMTNAQSDIKKDLPQFDVNKLLGINIDTFHKNPAHQRGMLAGLNQTFTSQLELGGRTFRIIANPVRNDAGERIGTVVEWADRTQEVAVEREVQDIVSAVVEGELSERISLKGKTGFFEALATGINGLVDNVAAVVEDVQSLVSAANDGDLTERMKLDGKAGLFVKIGTGINQLTDNMAEIVAGVQAAATEVNRGADEISQGNANLSQRTEEQASSLEETASSMEEMTSTVKQNADNSGQANQLATAARDQAEKGGAVVAKAVEAMTEINDSSKKIADIIGVIDEIAFQTNLLALNAAVEAARAGEQGRGFAVVASEVRNLAGRSATAAKEIKGLIQDSVKKVEEGSSLVNQSGQTLEQIVTAVKKVSDIIAEIAAASQEQSSGIEQVNKAVMQLDELTQQNAALVEEASAASQSMADQAGSLNDMMSRYRVSAEAAAKAQQAMQSTGSGGKRDGHSPSADQQMPAERRGGERPWSGAAPSKPAAPGNVRKAPARPAATGTHDAEWQEF